MRTARLTGLFKVLGTGVGVVGMVAGAAGQTLRVIALTGQPAPGVAQSQLTMVGRPVVDGAGRSWFTAQYNAPGGFRNVLMTAPPWVGAGPGFPPPAAAIAWRQGDEIVELGPPNVWGSTFARPAASGGRVAFTGAYTGGTGLWETTGAGVLSLSGTTMAGVNAPGVTSPFVLFDGIASAGQGQLAVRASLNGPAATSSGIWYGPGGGLAPYVIEGDLPPDVPGDVQYDDLGMPLFDPVVNASGVIAFLAPLRGNVDATNNRGIVAGPAGGERMVARTGAPAPGMPDGAVFATLGAPWINSDNDVVFTGRVTGGGVGPNDDEGLWIVRWPLVTPELITREGVLAPGIGGGVLLHERTSGLASFRQTVIADGTLVAFVSGLLGPGINNDNDSVLCVAVRAPDQTWELLILAREGQDAPGLTPGTDRYGPFGQVWVDRAGEIAFTNQLQGGSAWALFAGRVGSGVSVVAAAGRPLDIGSPGAPDVRNVRFFFNQFGPAVSSGGGDGLATCLPGTGTVIFRAEFDTGGGGSGVFEKRIRPAADINGDGMVSVQDIFDFLEAWFSRFAEGDFNGDGAYTVQDIFDMLERFFSM